METVHTREVKISLLGKRKKFHGIANVWDFKFTVEMKLNATEELLII